MDVNFEKRQLDVVRAFEAVNCERGQDVVRAC